MTQPESVAAAKQALRAEMTERRRMVTAGERESASLSIAETGLGFVGIPRRAVVSGFAAFEDELDPLPLMAALADAGHPLALPVTTGRGNPLVFRLWSPDAPLVDAAFGLREPSAEAPEVLPDTLLVPLLAFDAAGYRLGFGAGYYDRTLAKLRAAGTVVAIGIAFDIQKVDNVPHDRYDERLDWVLTPSGPLKIEGN
mgnify:CR=1 FL=1